MHISSDLIPAAIELLIVLGVMVLVHEFGHFAAAKLCGVCVETFSIGFGTRLLGFRHGDTDYRLSILPLGGYVKMAGDVPGEAPSGDPGEFNAHPRWQRVIIALAGPVANFILTFVILFGLGYFHNEVEAFRAGASIVDYVPQNTPVAATGMQTGDTIVRFLNVDNPTWEDVLNKTLLNLNTTVPFSFEHEGKRADTSIFLASKTGPEDFDPSKLGLIPRVQTDPMLVATVAPGRPGEQAGLKPNDALLSVNGHSFHSVPALLAYLQDQRGTPQALLVGRGGQTLAMNVTPVLGDEPEGPPQFQIGFTAQQPPVAIKNLAFGPAISQGASRSLKKASLIVDVIKGMFTHRVSVKSVSGPIGIGQQVHEAFKLKDKERLFDLMAFISVNLGIFNLLPIPILDGGMILFLFIESVMRRDLNQQIKERVYQVAFVCLIAFAAFVIFNDITRLSSH